MSDRVDTVFSQGSAQDGTASVRIRADKLGTLRPDGAFVPDTGTVDIVVGLTQDNGVWRLSSVPPGTIVRRSDLRANTRPVRIWFLAAVGGAPVGETRYLATSPARSVPARVLDELFSGPSDGLRGAALSALPPGALLSSAVGTTSEGVTTVDLTRVGPVAALDEGRRTEIAQQVVLTLAGVGVDRVPAHRRRRPAARRPPGARGRRRPRRPPPTVRDRQDLPSDRTAGDAAAMAPAVVVTGGRVRAVPQDPAGGADAGRPIAPDLVTGVEDARSARTTPDGRNVAVVGLEGVTLRLSVGRAGAAVAPTSITGTAMTRPSWTPDGAEVWTVLDGRPVRAVRRGASTDSPVLTPVALDTAPLAGLGPLTMLRLSPDGTKVALVAGGRVAIATVVRDAGGGAQLGAVRVLRLRPPGGGARRGPRRDLVADRPAGRRRYRARPPGADRLGRRARPRRRPDDQPHAAGHRRGGGAGPSDAGRRPGRPVVAALGRRRRLALGAGGSNSSVPAYPG